MQFGKGDGWVRIDHADEAKLPAPAAARGETEPWERALFGSGPGDPRIRRCFGLGSILTRSLQEENYALLAAGTVLFPAGWKRNWTGRAPAGTTSVTSG